jgi:hypothetical protein
VADYYEECNGSFVFHKRRIISGLSLPLLSFEKFASECLVPKFKFLLQTFIFKFIKLPRYCGGRQKFSVQTISS